MGVVRTTDGNLELVTIADDAGADFAHTLTFATPVEIVRIKMAKPAAGTLIAQSLTASGPTTTIGAASLGATDTSYYSNNSDLLHRVGLESIVITATGCGAGTSVTLSAQNLLSEDGRDF